MIVVVRVSGFQKHAFTKNLAPLQGASLCGCGPGVKTPGLVLLPLRGMKLIVAAIFPYLTG